MVGGETRTRKGLPQEDFEARTGPRNGRMLPKKQDFIVVQEFEKSSVSIKQVT
jgi:hypothetical protein